jgi:hypothetical protein
MESLESSHSISVGYELATTGLGSLEGRQEHLGSETCQHCRFSVCCQRPLEMISVGSGAIGFAPLTTSHNMNAISPKMAG